MKIVRMLLIIMVLLTTGCISLISSEGKLRLGPGEKWDLNLEFLIRSEDAQGYGPTIAQALDRMVQSAVGNGAQSSWDQKAPDSQGNVLYTIQFKGTGYATFNSVFVGSAVINKSETDGEEIISFYMNPLDGGASYETSFELVGGNILSTNGSKQTNTSVRWDSAMAMEAVMEPPNSSGTAVFWIFIGIMLVVGFIGNRAGWFRKQPSPELRPSYPQSTDQLSPTRSTWQEATPSPVQSSAQLAENESPIQETDSENTSRQDHSIVEHSFCPNCGAVWVQNARFCNRCGFQG